MWSSLRALRVEIWAFNGWLVPHIACWEQTGPHALLCGEPGRPPCTYRNIQIFRDFSQWFITPVSVCVCVCLWHCDKSSWPPTEPLGFLSHGNLWHQSTAEHRQSSNSHRCESCHGHGLFTISTFTTCARPFVETIKMQDVHVDGGGWSGKDDVT